MGTAADVVTRMCLHSQVVALLIDRIVQHHVALLQLKLLLTRGDNLQLLF